MTRHAGVRHAVIERLLACDDPLAWHFGSVLTEDLYGTPVTKWQLAMVWRALHRLHDEGVVQFQRHGPAQHVITVRLDPAYRETRGQPDSVAPSSGSDRAARQSHHRP